MIPTLYDTFKPWSEGGSIWILSDTHFDDADCKLMAGDWISPKEQITIINKKVHKNDTLIHLGDVGNPIYIPEIRAKRKILLLGNHDKPADYQGLFTEIFAGPLIIAEKILLSHEPVLGLPWCLNIHGHDHSNTIAPDKYHLNLAANVCRYTPANLKEIIKTGYLSHIPSIHRITIDNATARKNQS